MLSLKDSTAYARDKHANPEAVTMLYDTFQSPIGIITLASNGTHLQELHIEGDRYFRGIPTQWVHKPQAAILIEAKQELAAYFEGKRSGFSVPVTYSGTEFQNEVWRELQQIPAGQTLTYADLAQRIGKPKAARAVGTAIGRNPLCIVVPCHRVVSSGGLGGYVAGLARKQYLLELEHNNSN